MVTHCVAAPVDRLSLLSDRPTAENGNMVVVHRKPIYAKGMDELRNCTQVCMKSLYVTTMVKVVAVIV